MGLRNGVWGVGVVFGGGGGGGGRVCACTHRQESFLNVDAEWAKREED